MLNRSVLSVPSLLQKLAVKAAGSSVDVVMLDLEDSVPALKKQQAREQLVETLKGVSFGSKTLTVRVNGVHSPDIISDIKAIVTSPSYGKIHSIVVPKVDDAGDVAFICRLITATERANGVSHSSFLRIEASLESPRGINNANAIATASARVRSLVFGIADYTAALGAPLDGATGHGDANPSFPPALRWVWAMSTIANVAAANNIIAIDAPFGQWKEPAAVEAAARSAHALGYTGKWAIHPDQIAPINNGFTPTAQQIAAAEAIVGAHPEAAALLAAGWGTGGAGGVGVGAAGGAFGGSAADAAGGAVHGGAQRAVGGDGMMDAATLRVAMTTLAKAGRGRAV